MWIVSKIILLSGVLDNEIVSKEEKNEYVTEAPLSLPLLHCLYHCTVNADVVVPTPVVS